jgi:hypothetical protein
VFHLISQIYDKIKGSRSAARVIALLVGIADLAIFALVPAP